MFKLTQVIHVAVGSLLVVPAVSLSQGSAQGLEGALSDTVRALENLAGIRDDLAGDTPDHGVVTRLFESTEAPIEPPRRRDDLLVSLRDDVSRLRMLLDQIESGRPPTTIAGTSPSPVVSSTDTASPMNPATAPGTGITTGLDEPTRSLISGIAAPVGTQDSTPRTGAESEGFAADPLRLGRAYYRAGRWAEALTLLTTLGESAQATYWRARCLEKLGRDEEARDEYRKAIDAEDAGWVADRAKGDLAFLEWKLEFEQRAAREAKRRAPAKAPTDEAPAGSEPQGDERQ